MSVKLLLGMSEKNTRIMMIKQFLIIIQYYFISSCLNRVSLNKKGDKVKNYEKIQKKRTPSNMETSEEWEVEMKLVETCLLLCRSILNQIKMNAEEEDTPNKSMDKVETVDNEIPKSEDINNDFLTNHINLVAMNVCGVKGKEKILQTILNRNDVRIGILSETWLIGKEKPDLGQSFTTFISNRADKTNRGGVAIVIEKSLTENSVVIGRNNEGDQN